MRKSQLLEETLHAPMPEGLGLCYCANEGALELVLNVMVLMARECMRPYPDVNAGSATETQARVDANEAAWKAFYAEFSAERQRLLPGPLWELFAHWLNSAGLAEHGGGVNASWLTDRGKSVLEELQRLKAAGWENDESTPASVFDPMPDPAAVVRRVMGPVYAGDGHPLCTYEPDPVEPEPESEAP